MWLALQLAFLFCSYATVHFLPTVTLSPQRDVKVRALLTRVPRDTVTIKCSVGNLSLAASGLRRCEQSVWSAASFYSIALPRPLPR